MGARFNKLLVLDLDETLIHSRYFQDLDGRPERDPDHYPGDDIATWERPGVREFLIWCFDNFAGVGIWTVGTRPYADEVLPLICDVNRLAFVYCRDRCTHLRNLDSWTEYWVKDIRKLRKLGFPRTHILCVDDSPEKFERSYGNYIPVREFEGDPSDDELPRLRRYLEMLGPVPNVRTIEKRRWWDRVEIIEQTS